jgi:hypothetical protein
LHIYPINPEPPTTSRVVASCARPTKRATNAASPARFGGLN